MNKKIALFFTGWTSANERFLKTGTQIGVEITPIHYSQLICQASQSNWEILFKQKPLSNFNLFYFRTIGDKNEHLPLILDYAKQHQIPITDEYLYGLGGAYRKRKSSEAMILLKNGISYPKSLFISDQNKLKTIAQNWTKPIILKSTNGRHGTGTYLVQNNDQIERILLGRKTANFLLQEYIPNGGDYRLFLVGYQVIAGFKRQKKEKQLVLNRSQGNSEGLSEIPESIKQEAEKAAKTLQVEIAAIDLVIDERNQKPVVIEVNQAPEFYVMEKKTGLDIARKIVEYLVNKAK